GWRSQGRRKAGAVRTELLDAPRGLLFATSRVPVPRTRSTRRLPPDYNPTISPIQAPGPDSGVRSLYSPQVPHGKSARAQRVPPASGSRDRQEGGGARPEGQSGGSRLQRDGLPLRALRDRSSVGGQAAVLRQGSV